MKKGIMGQFLKISIGILFFLSSGFLIEAANPPYVVINEIAWMGTTVSYNDEWIELRNNTDQEINLDGWVLKASDGTPEIKLTKSTPANGFYLLERTDDNTVPGIMANKIYTGALGNNGENLRLYDDLGNLIDSIDASSGWPAGDNTAKQTMERTDSGWQTSAAPGGTPAAENSSPILPENNYPATAKTVEDEPPQAKTMAAAEGAVQKIQNEQVLEKPNTYFVFFAAAFTSFFSGVIILILKKKLKLS